MNFFLFRFGAPVVARRRALRHDRNRVQRRAGPIRGARVQCRAGARLCHRLEQKRFLRVSPLAPAAGILHGHDQPHWPRPWRSWSRAPRLGRCHGRTSKRLCARELYRSRRGFRLGCGFNANALVGGNGNSTSLQPLSAGGSPGINLSAGIGALSLQPAASEPPRHLRHHG